MSARRIITVALLFLVGYGLGSVFGLYGLIPALLLGFTVSALGE